MHRCWDVVHSAACFTCVSLCLSHPVRDQVYPAAGYAYEVASHGGKVAVFNLERSEGDDEADFLFLGPCEETLPQLILGK